ncbi:MAG: D-tyrosyl-tRNA(Tyr) deacylase [Desulfobacteraceae bacterium]|nr:D-tyrosyl-tRNA(Tyr) deacylase [Desulfobacteraceae bacterium]
MKAIVQRVKSAHITVDNKIISNIGNGLMVLLGVQEGDTKKEADYLVEKIIHLRIFEDTRGKMNLSLKDIKAELLVVSQFTLLGDCSNGRRPSFTKAAAPDRANTLYEYFIDRAIESKVTTKSGQFQALMDVCLVNQGPVTLVLDTRKPK